MKRAATIFIPATLIVGFVFRLPHYPCPDGQELLMQPHGWHDAAYSTQCV